MNKLVSILSVFIKRVCVCFTLIVLSFTVVGNLTAMESYNKGLAISQLTSFFWFACLFALSFLVADFVKNNVIVKRTLQFVFTYASLVLVFFTGNLFKDYLADKQNPAFSILAISFIFVVIYTVCAVAVLIGRFIMNKLTNSSKEYESMFEEQKSDK